MLWKLSWYFYFTKMFEPVLYLSLKKTLLRGMEAVWFEMVDLLPFLEMTKSKWLHQFQNLSELCTQKGFQFLSNTIHWLALKGAFYNIFSFSGELLCSWVHLKSFNDIRKGRIRDALLICTLRPRPARFAFVTATVSIFESNFQTCDVF